MAADSTATTTSASSLGADYADTASAAYRAALRLADVDPDIAGLLGKELAASATRWR